MRKDNKIIIITTMINKRRKKKIKAIIFDLNGVLIQSEKLSERFQKEFKISRKDFLPVLKEIMGKIRKPNAGDTFSYWKPYLERWGFRFTKEEFFNFWFSGERELPGIVDILNELKRRGFKLFILSNNFKERADYYQKNFPFLKIFDKLYYSFETGFVKPDPQAFKNLLSENNLRAQECIYFDNSEENIERAKNLGIKSFLFENEKSSDIIENILDKVRKKDKS